MISIIIPTYNRLDLLRQCVNSLREHCPGEGENYRIQVIATGSGDEAHWAADNGVYGDWLEGATFGQAVNAGMGQVRHNNAILLNNDTIIQDDIVAAFQRALTLFPSGAVIGARLLYPNGLVQHAGIGFDQGGLPYNLWRHAPAAHPAVNQPSYPPALTFACILIPRSVWQAVGPLDEGYRNAYEDVDWCLRAREQGYPLHYVPSVSAIHLEGQSPGRFDHDAESLQHYRENWSNTGRIWNALGVYPFQVGG